MSTPVQQTSNSMMNSETHKISLDANKFVENYYRLLENKPESLHELVKT